MRFVFLPPNERYNIEYLQYVGPASGDDCKIDACCDGETCKLKPGAACRFVHDYTCMTHTFDIVTAMTLAAVNVNSYPPIPSVGRVEASVTLKKSVPVRPALVLLTRMWKTCPHAPSMVHSTANVLPEIVLLVIINASNEALWLARCVNVLALRINAQSSVLPTKWALASSSGFTIKKEPVAALAVNVFVASARVAEIKSFWAGSWPIWPHLYRSWCLF